MVVTGCSESLVGLFLERRWTGNEWGLSSLSASFLFDPKGTLMTTKTLLATQWTRDGFEWMLRVCDLVIMAVLAELVDWERIGPYPFGPLFV